jgi:hypothetical protein
MSKKIKVVPLSQWQPTGTSGTRMTPAESMLLSNRVEELIEERIARRERGQSSPADEYEVIAE